MLNKSRQQGAADGGRRRYDLPGASLRSPYKIWMPKTDTRHSESENEGPRPAPSSSHRPHGHHGSATQVAAGNTATTTVPSSRNASTTSTQHAAPAPQKQRTERTPFGYASEASMHSPANPPTSSKPSSSFSLFKPHVKESRGHSSSTTRREELPRSTTAPAAVPTSKHTTSQPLNVPQKSTSRNAPPTGALFGSISTLSSTDPSPRSSTDSGPRNGHASAPAAEYSETRKQSHSTWNPYVDARVDRTATSRRTENPVAQPRRDEKKSKDKEDMVARVTEALGGGSTGKAKAVESALLQNQAQAVKRDDIGSARRTTTSTGARGVETQPYSQPQAPPSLRRTRATPLATPVPTNTHLPDGTSKSSRPSVNSRGHIEVPSRSHGPPEPPAKVTSPSSRIPTTSSSKLPHPRTASSPWPFNQALPPEQIMPPARPQHAQGHSSSWKQPFSKFQGSSTAQKTSDQKTSDTLPPPKESIPYPSSHGQSGDLGRSSQQAYTPSPAPHQQSSKNSLPRNTQPPSHAYATPAPPRAEPAPAPPPATQTRQNASYATTSTSAEPQRWSPNTVANGKTTHGAGGAQQSHSMSQAPWPATSGYPETTSAYPTHGHSPAPEPVPPPPQSTDKRYPLDSVQQSASTSVAPPRSGSSSNVGMQSSSNVGMQSSSNVGMQSSSNVGMQSHHESRTPWPTTGTSEQRAGVPSAPEPVPVANGRYATVSMPSSVPDASVHMGGRSAATSTTNRLWSTTSRVPEASNPSHTAAEPVNTIGGRKDSLATVAPAAGTWTSKYTVDTYPSSGYDTDDTPKEFRLVSGPQTGNTTNGGHSTHTPATNGLPSADRLVPGAWTSRYATANMSASTFEVVPAPKPPLKTPVGEGPTSATLKYASAPPPAPEPVNRGLRYVSTNTVPTSQPPTAVPGAWTTSTRYATNTSASTFDSSPANKATNGSPRDSPPRQATLGTTPVAGAWTTKQTSGSGTPSSSEATLKQTPNSNTPSPSSLLRPPPVSGANTGTSTPSTQISDIVNQLSPLTSHSISTRVPISGHPSTPAPVRPTLRATPPPLSISSTSPDTDSLLTPSSLNSPRSTIALPPAQPVSTITMEPQPHEKDTAPRKNGFFDFFRPKPTLKSYEVWTPPARPKDKERMREGQSREPPPPPKPRQTIPVPVPSRPKSPKVFSPFKLFSRRHRTVSSASLDVLDGTAPNTLMNSPASSMRADTPGAPPSPPLRDVYLATQEWRNKEATEHVVSGRKRRPRPGVTFDCPEDVAPIDIVPSRLRIGRIQTDDDDYD